MSECLGILREIINREGIIMTEVKAEWPGVVSEIKVSLGDSVTEDQEVVILESMKMLTPILAPAAGTVSEIAVEQGQYVDEGTTLIKLD
jgi:acetyl-CoA carboxylase biotin carboxyl carrier protein